MIDFFSRIVKVKACASGPGYAEPSHQRLVAMVTAAQSQSVLICESCEVVRMRRVHHETNQSATLFRRPENVHSWQFGKALCRVISQIRVMFENCRASNPFDVIKRRRESDRAGDVRCAGLKSVRRFFECALFQSHADNHFAAAVPWRY